MKALITLTTLGFIGLAGPVVAQTTAPPPAAPAAAAAAVTNAAMIGNYVVTGTETDGSKYDGDGTLAITMDKNGALELKWDGGKYVAIGQVEGTKLFAGGVADGRAVIMVMDVKPDGTAQGKWWRRTDAGTKGTEAWKKQ